MPMYICNKGNTIHTSVQDILVYITTDPFKKKCVFGAENDALMFET